MGVVTNIMAEAIKPQHTMMRSSVLRAPIFSRRMLLGTSNST
jgi:hypothetical protein